ncbi:MAG: NAD(P)/FAD-dependent oxidoreductase [Sphingobacteriia bacterium]|nr:NAD(P)/FAD-dependent oxidoreductase [Sphingobacteriia bacterium]
MSYDAIVVGGGIAGLTAAAYIARSGRSVKLFEKQPKPGGLVQTFARDGVWFDTGLRSIENSGIVFPMLKQLGLDIEFRRSFISIGIGNKVIKVVDKNSIADYASFLKSHYPESERDVSIIIKEIKKIMGYMDVLYGIDNPALMDLTRNPRYTFGKLLPWLFRFLFTMGKINKLYEPVEQYLQRLTGNQSLIDIITQHFFRNMPTSFALSYFSLYLDYYYPKGGTATVVNSLAEYIGQKGGTLKMDVTITTLNPEEKYIIDSNGNRTEYRTLIWAGDLKQLYNSIPIEQLKNEKLATTIKKKQTELAPLKGGDTLFTLYLTVAEERAYFERICTGHFFYTPDKRGLSTVSKKAMEDFLHLPDTESDPPEMKRRIKAYLLEHFKMNTFEIAIPVLRDADLAPEGKVGVEVSLFMDYELDKKIEDCGWTEEMREYREVITIDILNDTLFPGIRDKVTDRFSSSPLTLEKLTGNSHGAITGWAFTNPILPAVNKMLKVNDSVKTLLPDVFQAGQWTYSPSGFPMSVVTGKLSADKVISTLRKKEAKH